MNDSCTVQSSADLYKFSVGVYDESNVRDSLLKFSVFSLSSKIMLRANITPQLVLCKISVSERRNAQRSDLR